MIENGRAHFEFRAIFDLSKHSFGIAAPGLLNAYLKDIVMRTLRTSSTDLRNRKSRPTLQYREGSATSLISCVIFRTNRKRSTTTTTGVTDELGPR
jgi:hypothetical protein